MYTYSVFILIVNVQENELFKVDKDCILQSDKANTRSHVSVYFCSNGSLGVLLSYTIPVGDLQQVMTFFLNSLLI